MIEKMIFVIDESNYNILEQFEFAFNKSVVDVNKL